MIECEASVAVDADRERLRQLFENLYRNAIEHGGADVNVTVDVLPDRQGVSVADDGTEIPQDIRDRLFEPGATTREDGAGFGLAIVADIVRAHGWEISATDSQACGARFAMPGMCLDAVAAEDPYPSGGVATSFDSVIGRSSRISPHSAARTPGWCRVSPDE